MSWFRLLLAEESKAYRAGEVIFEAGDPADCMYVVAEGEVEISIAGQSVEVLRREMIFGEMALISKEPRSGKARARTDCRVVEIQEERFFRLVHQTPYFALEVMRVLAQRLRRHDPND